MEQIRNYVDAMFSSLSQTAEINKIKQDMLENLEEKYNALLAEGKNGYEATGIILSTIGTADELRDELCSRQETSKQEVLMQPAALPDQVILPSPASLSDQVTLSTLADKQEFPHTSQQLSEYRSFKTKYNYAIACAVGMFILAPVLHIMLPDMKSRTLSYLPMFLMIAIGVGLCIYWDYRNTYYVQALGFRTRRNTALVPPDAPELDQFQKFKTRQGLVVALAVGLFILSPVIYYLGDELMGSNRGGILFMFIAVALGVGLCILSDSNEDDYKEIFSYHKEWGLRKREDFGFTSLFAGIAFSLATILYLYLGFFHNLWHPGWIVFPACALLTGICSMVESYVGTGKASEL